MEISPDQFAQEISALSSKLLTAVEKQAELEDQLAVAKQKNQESSRAAAELEKALRGYESRIESGVLIERKDMQLEKDALMKKLKEESHKRGLAEQDKLSIEQEVEDLTKSLFEEANQMVATARRDRAVLEHKNEQLQQRMMEKDELISSLTSELSGLKKLLQDLTESTKDSPVLTTTTSRSEDHDNINSRPISLQSSSTNTTMAAAENGYFNQPQKPQVRPNYSTSFSWLVTPVLRYDISVFNDFITTSRALRSFARPSSFSGASTSSSTLNNTHNNNTTTTNNNNSASSTNRLSTPVMASTASFAGPSPSFATNSSGLPATNSPQLNNLYAALSPSQTASTLKETRYFKRILADDIEPTLRLDLAPGLSWLSRRSLLNTMIEGNLSIDPIVVNNRYFEHHSGVPSPPTASNPPSPSLTPTSNPAPPSSRTPIPGGFTPNPSSNETNHLYQGAYLTPCCLCGESRSDSTHVRTHIVRMSDASTSSKHVLCPYCVARVRSVCDFLAFLRALRDGFIKLETKSDEQRAWDESVRLREQMFWARVGGGVIPNPDLVFETVNNSNNNNNNSNGKEEEEAKSLEDDDGISVKLKDPVPANLQDTTSTETETEKEKEKEKETERPTTDHT